MAGSAGRLPRPVRGGMGADYLSVGGAQKAIFPQASAFQEVLLPRTPGQPQALLARAGPQPPHGTLRVWSATRDGVLLGHVFVDEVIGRQSLITYAVGIDTGGALRHLEILPHPAGRDGELRSAPV